MERGLKSKFLQRKILIYEIRFSYGKSMSPRNTHPERGELGRKKFPWEGYAAWRVSACFL